MIVHCKTILCWATQYRTSYVKPLAIGIVLIISTSFNSVARAEDVVQRTIAPMRVQSWVADPFMNQAEEQAIWTWLRDRPRCFKNVETMRDLTKSFPSPHPDQAYFPIIVNADALEEIGVDVDSRIEQASGEEGYSVGTELFVILDRNDLTFLVRHGRLEITTNDDSESKLVTRIYDVTSMVSILRRGGKSIVSFDVLTEAIYTAVHPDTWEMLGGPSTMTSSIVNNRCLLVASAPTSVHMDVQQLLDQLTTAGRLPEIRPSPVLPFPVDPRLERATSQHSTQWTDSIPTSVW